VTIISVAAAAAVAVGDGFEATIFKAKASDLQGHGQGH